MTSFDAEPLAAERHAERAVVEHFVAWVGAFVVAVVRIVAFERVAVVAVGYLIAFAVRLV